jgi:hypothetical protein
MISDPPPSIHSKLRFRIPNILVFQVIKYDTSDNKYKNSGLPTAGSSIYKRRTAINQPQTGRNRRGKGSDMRIKITK